MYLSTCISGGYHVMVEPRFPSYVYSTCVFKSAGSPERMGHKTCTSLSIVIFFFK